MDTPQILQRAITAIRNGDNTTGQRLLAQVLWSDPYNATAWFWLSRAVDDPAKQRECLERVLAIDPDNQTARRMLEELTKPLIASPITEKQPAVKPRPKPRKKQPTKPRSKHQATSVLVVLIAIACIALCVIASIMGNGGEGEGDTPTPSMAYVMCQEFVEDQLVAPATAKFPGMSEVVIVSIKNEQNAYRVSGYVDAQNRMGALIRNYYVCEIKYVGDDKWRLLDLEFSDW